jgi:hypothetical protein
LNRSTACAAALACGLAGGASAQTAAPPPSGAPATQPTDETTQGIVVTALPPSRQTRIDRKVYGVAGNLQSVTGTAADVLNEVPSVDVDADGNVTLRGDPHVTILIDGKPSAQFAGAAAGTSLQQLPASDIDRIEVMTNPPAQYKAEGSGGVINIVTRKHRTPGFSGDVRASGGDQGRYLLGADGAYNTGKLKLSGSAGLRWDLRERLTTSNRQEADPVTGVVTQSHEGIDEHFKRLTPQANAAADYELSQTQSIGGEVSWRQLTGHRFFNQDDESRPPDQPIDQATTRFSDGHELSLAEGAGAHFEQKLARPGETLTVSLQASRVYESEEYRYTDGQLLPPGPLSFADLHLGLDLRTTELSVDYDLPLTRDRELKLGYDVEADHNDFNNIGHNFDPITDAATVDPNVTDHFLYRQWVNAFYGAYDAPLGRWSLQAGLRFEATRTSTLEITGNVPGGQHYAGVYPSLQLERPMRESDKVVLGVARRITRPDPEALNPFPDHQDIYNLRAGNPNLAPQDSWTLDAGYVHSGRLSWSGTAYYRLDRNSVTDVIEPLGDGVVLDTKENLPKSQSAGLEFSADGKLTRRLSGAVSGEAFWTEIDARLLGSPGLASTTGVNLKASLDYRPTQNDLAQVSLSHTAARLTAQGSIGPINLVNLGYKHDLAHNLAIVLTATDVLNGQKLHRVVAAPGLTDDYLRYQVGQIVLAGVVYTFGAPAKSKSAGFDYGD